ncbi:hypothetical protein J3E64_000989 [Sphingobium sp. OAS761]|uniref:hypothetical protein n=1 Tax=Sphingobium sp. OAS761 TaxID=2817901 RepID=UPI00209FCF68|nr:hypothetical protein [Sphingobium sp. OAS761]MCP1469314.1 hypothetical protein [Sphingobium sp. OAS761]
MSRKFTPRSGVKLSEGEARRQSRVTKLALDKLGASAAIVFLNGHLDDLSGRPIQLAVASDEGLESVERLLAKTPAIAR